MAANTDSTTDQDGQRTFRFVIRPGGLADQPASDARKWLPAEPELTFFCTGDDFPGGR